MGTGINTAPQKCARLLPFANASAKGFGADEDRDDLKILNIYARKFLGGKSLRRGASKGKNLGITDRGEGAAVKAIKKIPTSDESDYPKAKKLGLENIDTSNVTVREKDRVLSPFDKNGFDFQEELTNCGAVDSPPLSVNGSSVSKRSKNGRSSSQSSVKSYSSENPSDQSNSTSDSTSEDSKTISESSKSTSSTSSSSSSSSSSSKTSQSQNDGSLQSTSTATLKGDGSYNSSSKTSTPNSGTSQMRETNGRLSPNSLSRKLLAEIELLETVEASNLHLTELEQQRNVALAQQETVAFAEILKAVNDNHEKEKIILKDNVKSTFDSKEEYGVDSPLKDKEKSIRVKLNSEREEIERLKEAYKSSIMELKLCLYEQTQAISEMAMKSRAYRRKLKAAPVQISPNADSVTSSVPSEPLQSPKRSASSPESSGTGSLGSNISKKLKTLFKLSDDKYLTKREKKLVQAKETAEQLIKKRKEVLDWEKRLKEEENEVQKMLEEALSLENDLMPGKGHERTPVRSSTKDRVSAVTEKKIYQSDFESDSSVQESLLISGVEPIESERILTDEEIQTDEDIESLANDETIRTEVVSSEMFDDYDGTASIATQMDIESERGLDASEVFKGSESNVYTDTSIAESSALHSSLHTDNEFHYSSDSFESLEHSPEAKKIEAKFKSDKKKEPKPKESCEKSSSSDDVSDLDSLKERIEFLKKSLDAKKKEAKRLYGEKKKRNEARLKKQEKNLLKQLKAVEKVIEETKAALPDSPVRTPSASKTASLVEDRDSSGGTSRKDSQDSSEKSISISKKRESVGPEISERIATKESSYTSAEDRCSKETSINEEISGTEDKSVYEDSIKTDISLKYGPSESFASEVESEQVPFESTAASAVESEDVPSEITAASEVESEYTPFEDTAVREKEGQVLSDKNTSNEQKDLALSPKASDTHDPYDYSDDFVSDKTAAKLTQNTSTSEEMEEEISGTAGSVSELVEANSPEPLMEPSASRASSVSSVPSLVCAEDGDVLSSHTKSTSSPPSEPTLRSTGSDALVILKSPPSDKEEGTGVNVEHVVECLVDELVEDAVSELKSIKSYLADPNELSPKRSERKDLEVRTPSPRKPNVHMDFRETISSPTGLSDIRRPVSPPSQTSSGLVGSPLKDDRLLSPLEVIEVVDTEQEGVLSHDEDSELRFDAEFVDAFIDMFVQSLDRLNPLPLDYRHFNEIFSDGYFKTLLSSFSNEKLENQMILSKGIFDLLNESLREILNVVNAPAPKPWMEDSLLHYKATQSALTIPEQLRESVKSQLPHALHASRFPQTNTLFANADLEEEEKRWLDYRVETEEVRERVVEEVFDFFLEDVCRSL
eukprot:Nk52_evm58s352 gene=Nk52_evmTU58s352